MAFLGSLIVVVSVWPESAAKTFTFSPEPNRVALLVAVAAPKEAIARSMTLYGDGRLVLMRHGAGRRLLEEHVLQLETDEIEALLRIAADHEIPDYDAEDFITRQERGCKSDGAVGILEKNSDIVHVNVALDSYTSYGKTRNDIFVRLRTQGLKSTIAACPQMLEYRGMQRLIEQLRGYWEAAGGTPW